MSAPWTAMAAATVSEPSWWSHLGVTLALALLPVIAVAGTSFLKISVVLAALRSALGGQGFPPAGVLTAVAAAISLFIMAPVGVQMMEALEAETAARRETISDEIDPLGLAGARRIYAAASAPLLDFLEMNTPVDEVAFFSDLLDDTGKAPKLTVLLPAFATSQLMEAFFISVLVLLPFVVVDILTAITLNALGLQGLAPIAVSLPLKLLLLVAADGWHIIVSGLVLSYGT